MFTFYSLFNLLSSLTSRFSSRQAGARLGSLFWSCRFPHANEIDSMTFKWAPRSRLWLQPPPPTRACCLILETDASSPHCEAAGSGARRATLRIIHLCWGAAVKIGHSTDLSVEERSSCLLDVFVSASCGKSCLIEFLDFQRHSAELKADLWSGHRGSDSTGATGWI